MIRDLIVRVCWLVFPMLRQRVLVKVTENSLHCAVTRLSCGLHLLSLE